MSPSQCSLDVHLCAELSVPAEIHQQLFGLPGVQLEVVLLAPIHKKRLKVDVGLSFLKLSRYFNTNHRPPLNTTKLEHDRENDGSLSRNINKRC